MKNKLYFLFLCLFTCGYLCSQVGINTTNPLVLFHIDADGQTTTAGANSLDDVVIKEVTVGSNIVGNAGIGTLNPSARLEIFSPVQGVIKIADGTHGDGKILVSDENGNASWALQNGTLIKGVVNLGNYTTSNSYLDPAGIFVASNVIVTNNYIVIPPGRKAIVSIMARFFTESRSGYTQMFLALSTNSTTYVSVGPQNVYNVKYSLENSSLTCYGYIINVENLSQTQNLTLYLSVLTGTPHITLSIADIGRDIRMYATLFD